MATYSFHRLIMGKEEVDNFFCLIGDICFFFFTEMFIESTFHMTYSSHRLIMGKVEIDNFCQVIGDI